MPYLSRAAALARAKALLAEQHASIGLVVVDHAGKELVRVGGRWNRFHKRFERGECEWRTVKLQRSQQDAGKAMARYVKARLGGKTDRAALLMFIGNRGGGKTFLMALLFALLAIALPGCWQICVNITSKQKRDVMGALKKIIGAKSNPKTGRILPGGWVANDNTDLRDPSTVFLTGSTILWASSKNPDALRTAELDIEHVGINEGQSQPVDVFNNAAGAIRNKGGVVSIATNPPQRARGNFIAKLYQAIDSQAEGAPKNGEAFIIANSLNAAIDQPTLAKIRWMLLAADRRAAEADADGVIKVAGDLGYPDFIALPRHRGGHLGEVPHIGWTDVTREETQRVAGSAFDYIAGADFQQNPGSCATVGKLYRTETGQLVRVVLDFVTTEGSNSDLSQGFISRRYFPGEVDPTTKQRAPGRRLLIVGDATGKHQGPRHDFDGGEIYSYVELRHHGWTVVPPDHHWKTGVPRNPFIDESRRQMQSVLLAQALLLGPGCDKQQGRFPSLVEGFQNSLINSAGKFVKKEHFTHGPDCERYVCWAFLPRPQAPEVDQTLDVETFNQIFGIKPEIRG